MGIEFDHKDTSQVSDFLSGIRVSCQFEPGSVELCKINIAWSVYNPRLEKNLN